jgi:hypothetical protein
MPAIRRNFAGIAALVVGLTGADAQAQYQRNQSYADQYREQYEKTRTIPKSTVNYTIDKYFYHNPTISPYLNLVRPANQYTPRYQTYVKPELQRRQKQQVQQRAAFSPAVSYGSPSLKRTQYHDHWYGGQLSSP